MKAQTPPRAWAWAMMWLTSVVFPEDSGPKISTIRPRGTPPMPSARSSAREPVGIASTLTVPLSPRRISDPSPNSCGCRLTAPSQGRVLGFRLLRGNVVQAHFSVCHLNHLTAALMAARLGPAGHSADPTAGVQNGRGDSDALNQPIRFVGEGPVGIFTCVGRRDPRPSARTLATVTCGQKGRFSGS